jgi:two-component system, chemotaxis family, response regulator WspR
MTSLVDSSSVRHVIIWQNPDRQDGCQRDVLASVLHQHGYCLSAFKAESEVLQAILENVPDLLIIYLQASGEQGYEFCKILRKLPRTHTLPVVFVGTRAPFSELASALRCGGNEYLQLPLKQEECWLRLERHLRTVKLVRSLESERASLHQELWSYNHMLRQHEAVQISLAKENEALQRLAFVDGLTQVANRSSFNERILQLWHQAGEYQEPMSLLLCDIDYFKRYNDTYGHLAGDACLQAVAGALVRGAHRHRDQVARYGGEEFAILLPATDSDGAQQVALAVQSELAQAQVPHMASLVKPYVSLSIGICTLTPSLGPETDADRGCLPCGYERLIHGADEALYSAKLNGRDRVMVNTAEGLIAIVQDRCCYNNRSGSMRSAPDKLIVNEGSSTNALKAAKPMALLNETTLPAGPQPLPKRA